MIESSCLPLQHAVIILAACEDDHVLEGVILSAPVHRGASEERICGRRRGHRHRGGRVHNEVQHGASVVTRGADRFQEHLPRDDGDVLVHLGVIE